jgi:hypothetical protein
MSVVVHIPQALRPLCDGAARTAVTLPDGTPSTVATLLDLLGARHPALHSRLVDEQGRLRPHVNVFVDGVSVRGAGELSAVVGIASEVWVLPAISGGRSGV